MLGAPKKCAKCEKQVYSIEELKCLDKIWHKNCFKCTICNSVLNIKNYKGFDKQPYCVVHYPQQKHTQVADNPELLRIKENTKIQSNAKYHEDFEKSKGHYTVVTDDPETRRILENTKNISQVKYHEDFEKNIKNKYTPVADNPDTIRAIENQKIVSSVEYKGLKNQTNGNGTSNGVKPMQTSSSSTALVTNSSTAPLVATYRAGEKQMSTNQRKIGTIADYDPINNYEHKATTTTTNLVQPNHNRLSNGTGNVSSNGFYNSSTTNNQYHHNSYSNSQYQPQPAQVRQTSQTNLHSVDVQSSYNTTGSNGHYEFSNENYNFYPSSTNNKQQQIQQSTQYLVNSASYANDIKTTVYRAIYDYDAKEDDEISFRDGDKFINCEQIDVGWMIGVHEKTGKHGMFPANYAEPIDFF